MRDALFPRSDLSHLFCMAAPPRRRVMVLVVLSAWGLALGLAPSAHAADAAAAEPAASEARKPADDAELRYWLTNMRVYHRFSVDEIGAATGLTGDEIRSALDRFGIALADPPPRKPGDPLVMLPYPGGRHPRIGFLDGAIRPQRETKVTVFTPWDPASFVVLDLPEAVWSNLGLTYLAHTHIDTVWSAQGVELEKLEWRRADNGALHGSRRLPNGIRFDADVAATAEAVRVDFALFNGTPEPLSGLRCQMCVMLSFVPGMEGQTNDNKVFRHPYMACRSGDGRRWIITAWDPCFRTWANPNCPCMHSDPQLPDCPPGETVRATGFVWFYEGTDLDGELKRLAAETGWAMDPDHPGPGPRRQGGGGR